MAALVRGSFVISDELRLEAFAGWMLVEGRVQCEGGIYLDITEGWNVQGTGPEAIVTRSQYSYNAAIQSRGNIFRYNSPHYDHNLEHHVHQFDVLHGDAGGCPPVPIYDENQTPTLYEAIAEAERWYEAHLEELIASPVLGS